jgi:hypothetical protein
MAICSIEAANRVSFGSILRAPCCHTFKSIARLKRIFSEKTVKPITAFDAKHHKGGGFRENILFGSI